MEDEERHRDLRRFQGLYDAHHGALFAYAHLMQSRRSVPVYFA